jgi:alpha-galactosidase
MLEVGNPGLTEIENRSHFSLWAMMAAPMIAGNDVANMDAATRAILLNKEVIAVDQDRLGIQGRRVVKQGESEVWFKPLSGGGHAVVLFNRAKTPARIGFANETLNLPASFKAKVRDLWAHKDLGTWRTRYEAVVAPHGVVMLRLDP